ncbi:MAG: pilus assembly protein PilM [Pirellulales bacterium]|nr:pilus assembly protein PilM [Pirellulales bacterium]
MPHLLALEWNGTEARLVYASGRGDRVVIEQAFAVEMRRRNDDGEQPEVDIGDRLVSALGARGIGRVETLVAIGRTNIELRQLSLPPAPDEELPDLVRFQAMREFNELDDDWLLDYVPLNDSPDEPRAVLAAAVGPDLVSQIQQTCEKAGLKPKRLVLRACAAAALLSHTQAARQGELRLLVDLLSDEADLTVVNDGRVVFMRTTRLGEPPNPQVLFGEIRRTMAAVQNQLAGRKVESIVLCGRGLEQSDLARRIQAELDVPTELFDPFDGLQLGPELEEALPDHPGRFTPLLGMLATEFARRPHAVDFLHPRRRPAPPSKWRRYSLPVAAAVVLLISYLGYRQWQYNGLQADIEKLNADLNNLDQLVKRAEKRREVAQSVEKWSIGDIVWLDALYEMHEKLPPASEAMLSHLTLKSTATGGEAGFKGFVKSLDVLKKVENKSSSQDDSVKPYAWQFNGTRLIKSAPSAAKSPPQPKTPSPPPRSLGGSQQAPPKKEAPK